MNPTLKKILLAPQGITERGLVACYAFDWAAGSQVLTDLSGNGYNGQNGSDPSIDANDITFNAIKGVFGGSAYAVMPLDSFPTGAFTAQIVGSMTGTEEPLLGFSNTDLYPGAYCPFNSKYLLFMGASNYRYWTHGVVNGDDGGVHNFVFMMPGQAQADINNATLYVDSKLQIVDSTVATGLVASKTVYNIGRCGGGYLNGSIYYVLIYNTVLTETEIRTNNKALKKILLKRGVMLP